MAVLGAFLAHLVLSIPSTKLATFWANFIHNAIEIFEYTIENSYSYEKWWGIEKKS